MYESNDTGTGREYRGVWGYVINIAYGISRLITAIFCGADHRIYFSSQCGRWLEQGKRRGTFFVPVINFLLRDNNHCQNSWEKAKQVIQFERSINDEI